MRTYEAKGNKFNVGTTGNKTDKYVEAAKGTNLFFAIYKDETGKRNYETIPLNIVIENQKQGALQNIKPQNCSVPNKNEKGDSLFFHLSPNDLVYVPTNDELENPNLVDFKKLSKEQIKRFFNVNDFSGITIYYTPNQFSKAIAPKELDSSFDSKQSKLLGQSIKDVCWKIKMDRLGNISSVIK